MKYLRTGQTAGKVSYQGMATSKKTTDETQKKPGRERPFLPDEEIIQEDNLIEEEPIGGKRERRKGKVYVPW